MIWIRRKRGGEPPDRREKVLCAVHGLCGKKPTVSGGEGSPRFQELRHEVGPVEETLFRRLVIAGAQHGRQVGRAHVYRAVSDTSK